MIPFETQTECGYSHALCNVYTALYVIVMASFFLKEQHQKLLNFVICRTPSLLFSSYRHKTRS